MRRARFNLQSWPGYFNENGCDPRTGAGLKSSVAASGVSADSSGGEGRRGPADQRGYSRVEAREYAGARWGVAYAVRRKEGLKTKPLYEPKGKAKEYGDYAVNIYTGCPHRCYYCFAPNVLHRDRETFHSVVAPRPGIVDALRKQIEHEGVKGKLIHLCFTCDPYPIGYDSSTTRKIIKVIKESGNHVQILTKGDGSRDFDLLDENDWYGVTIDGSCIPKEAYRILDLCSAQRLGIKTWVSFEPVIDTTSVLQAIEICHFVDKVKIGKLNYHPSDIDWAAFGREAESLCQRLGIDYYIKESLRQEMDKEGQGDGEV